MRAGQAAVPPRLPCAWRPFGGQRDTLLAVRPPAVTLRTRVAAARRSARRAALTPRPPAGLVPPAAALYLLGRGGAILMVIMLFMAVTSSGSAELVAVSSLFTYDVYRTYINPNATGTRAPPARRSGPIHGC